MCDGLTISIVHYLMYYPFMTMTTNTVSLNALARFGHALSDETRVRILMLLAEKPRYPADMADELNIARQSISNHLACLRGCGLVTIESEGRRSRYQLGDERVGHALIDLQDVVLHTDPELCDKSDEKECC